MPCYFSITYFSLVSQIQRRATLEDLDLTVDVEQGDIVHKKNSFQMTLDVLPQKTSLSHDMYGYDNRSDSSYSKKTQDFMNDSGESNLSEIKRSYSQKSTVKQPRIDRLQKCYVTDIDSIDTKTGNYNYNNEPDIVRVSSSVSSEHYTTDDENDHTYSTIDYNSYNEIASLLKDTMFAVQETDVDQAYTDKVPPTSHPIDDDFSEELDTVDDQDANGSNYMDSVSSYIDFEQSLNSVDGPVGSSSWKQNYRNKGMPLEIQEIYNDCLKQLLDRKLSNTSQSSDVVNECDNRTNAKVPIQQQRQPISREPSQKNKTSSTNCASSDKFCAELHAEKEIPGNGPSSLTSNGLSNRSNSSFEDEVFYSGGHDTLDSNPAENVEDKDDIDTFLNKELEYLEKCDINGYTPGMKSLLAHECGLAYGQTNG